ncbi:hypothetical protein C900_05425 [Fulvivirga imtechensis AK7]|uniref:Uncharacterized protein n=1 Tax=Fulvivirga imtechensis AK7 TaxID=1237149 RepID=L8JK07_9BACT|nr:hypothetical protein C900_05425 [Fulvivirga imtechensis AK7]
MFINNSGEPYQVIAEGSVNELDITNVNLLKQLNAEYNG